MRLIAALVLLVVLGCETKAAPPPTSASGVRKASVEVPTGLDALTTEQRAIRDRLLEDNKPGAIKHLYVISAYSGDVILYSTVRGKVTSSGKRLTPTSVAAMEGQHVGSQHNGFLVGFGDSEKRTGEVLQDDGTYGSSVEYVYWWDTKGVYHQHYVAGGQILHVSSQPIAVKRVILNLSSAQ